MARIIYNSEKRFFSLIYYPMIRELIDFEDNMKVDINELVTIIDKLV